MFGLSGSEWYFLLKGMGWTVALSAMGMAGGAVFGLAVAFLRTAPQPWLQRLTAGYIAVFQGTPLLMQLFVTYYGLALVGLNLDAWQAVAIGFTLNASAFLGEIWRGAVESIPRGQSEAARALGLHYMARMRLVIMPQAFKVSLPATVGLLVQLIKGTSLAAIVGFTELARSGSIISNQNFRPLLVYAIVGALYFALCWPLSLYGSRLEAKLARGAR